MMHVLIYCTTIYWSYLLSNDIRTSVQLSTTADGSLNGYMVAPREDTGAPLGPDVAYVGSWENGADMKLLCNGVSTVIYYNIIASNVNTLCFMYVFIVLKGSCLLDTIITIIIIGRLATELSKWQYYSTWSAIMSHGAIITYIHVH